MSPVASTRWCPTSEQLMILEEMYRGGVKTPNATQIQQITAYLSLYGKIEGKNVFYWFQNHKARDRQKLRRQLCRQQQQMQQLHLHAAYRHLFDQQPSSPTSLGIHPFHHYFDSPQWLPQEGVVQEEPSQFMTNYSTKMHNGEMENWMNMYGQDCVMMDPPLCCSNRPLKTLQLFPVNSNSSLRDDQTDHQLN